ncbi:MAG: class I SAM-dependent methyltransferase [Candidatus Shapirobacteria bacterium]|jgi:ubiquinone/menaquinone biosynthesis C-methylase UbiE
MIHYEERYKAISKDWDNSLIILSNQLRKFIKQKGNIKILDAGCGRGNYLIDENRKEIDWASGIDISPAATKGNICLDEIKFGDLENIPYQDKTFEAVTSIFVLEHLKNPKIVFKEIHRVLKKGGIFLFLTPNKDSFLVRVKNLVNAVSLNGKLNYWLFGRKEDDIFPTYYLANEVTSLKHDLEVAGFQNCEVKTNFEPGYTTFGKFSFWLTRNIEYLGRLFKTTATHHHLVGWAIK